MKKAIPVVWFRHLPEAEQEDFKELLRSNNRTLGRFRDILKDEIEVIAKTEGKEDTYDSGYPYKQAFLNGRRESLKHILDYLSFLEE